MEKLKKQKAENEKNLRRPQNKIVLIKKAHYILF